MFLFSLYAQTINSTEQQVGFGRVLFSGLGFMLFPLFFLAFFIFWLLMLIDCIKRDFNDKIMWIILIVLLGILGALLYYFIVKRKKNSINPS